MKFEKPLRLLLFSASCAKNEANVMPPPSGIVDSTVEPKAANHEVTAEEPLMAGFFLKTIRKSWNRSG